MKAVGGESGLRAGDEGPAGVKIGAATRLTGLLGWPVEHSLSPRLHNAAFAAAGLDFIYLLLPVEAALLPAAVAGLKALGFAGANVTIPHKVRIIPCLDDLDASARAVGAVNTVVIRDNKAVGYNTDMQGFINSLAAAGVEVTGRRAAVLGAGGAARAVIAGLLAHGAAAVAVGSRDAGKTAGFAAGFGRPELVKGYGWDGSGFAKAAAECDIVINCTPVGMSPAPDRMPPLDLAGLSPEAVVCDLIYNPPETVLLAEARRRGHRTVNGAGMLAEQGMLAFELWTGVAAPRECFYRTLGAASGKRD